MPKLKPHLPGVSVWERRLKNRTVYIGRYTLPGPPPKRVALPARATWEEAFEAAAAEQRKVDRCSYRDSRKGSMTFNELVDDHWWPTVGALQEPTSQRNVTSHLGPKDHDGTPIRKGAKCARAARFYLRTVFGRRRIRDISPQDVRGWQAAMIEAGYGHGSILAKRAVLKGVLKLAVDNGWIDLNPVLAVAEPRKVAHADDERVVTQAEYLLLRQRLDGRATRLLIDLGLDTGCRFGELTPLRPDDVLDPDGVNPPRIHVWRNVTWPGKKFTGTGKPWIVNDYPKTKKDRTVAVGGWVFDELRAYIEAAMIAPTALIFDYGRLRAEHSTRRARDPLPECTPHGRYVNPTTGRSGPHGRYYTYAYGCRCVPCRNAYTEYRFWWERRRGRKSATPWLEPGFFESRSDAVDPVPNQWFNVTVFRPAMQDVFGTGWRPTPHDLRHAMVTWALDAGVSPRAVQLDAGHASLRTTDGYAGRLPGVVSTERVEKIAAVYAAMGLPVGPAPIGAAPVDAAAAPVDEAAVLAWLAQADETTVAAVLARALTRTTRPTLTAVADTS